MKPDLLYIVCLRFGYLKLGFKGFMRFLFSEEI